MRHTSRLAVLITVVLTVIAAASHGEAFSLYFERTAVNTRSEATCFRFAGDVARSLQFRNTRQNRVEVAGERSGTWVAITCIGRGQGNAVAVVMAEGPAAKQVVTEVASRIRGITCIDSPC